MRLSTLIEAIRLSSTSGTNGADWIRRVYDMFPENPLNPRQRYMHFGNDEVGVFELSPDIDIEDGATISWIRAHPQGKGIGRKTIEELQDLAKKDGITLTLYPWEDAEMGQDRLIAFYKSLGFEEQEDDDYLIWKPRT